MKYTQQSNRIVFESYNGDSYVAASADDHQAAFAAVAHLNRSLTLNAQRKYTASARAMRDAERVRGFQWIKGCCK